MIRRENLRKVIVKKVITDTIFLDDLEKENPIFAKKGGKLIGMIVLERFPKSLEQRGWILRIGESCGAYGYTDTLKECITKGIDRGFEFYVED